MLAELVPDARRRRTAALPLCPDCGSLLDAPRVGPSGRPDRRCRACLRWCGLVPRPQAVAGDGATERGG